MGRSGQVGRSTGPVKGHLSVAFVSRQGRLPSHTANGGALRAFSWRCEVAEQALASCRHSISRALHRVPDR
jgi:hypothetical protein